jgi:hypothetical protein
MSKTPEQNDPGMLQRYALPRAAALATRFRERYPAKGRDWLLTHRDYRAEPVHYRRTATRVSRLALAHYDPDPSGTELPLPGLYEKVAITTINESVIDVRESHPYDSMPTAIIWGLAGYAMAGVLTEQQSNALLYPKDLHTGEPRDPSYAMLLGGHPAGLDTAVGFYMPYGNTVYVPGGAVSSGPVVDLKDFRSVQSIY